VEGESGATITRQMRRLGASADWSRERFTMDRGLSAAVLETFVRLHADGLIYRGKRLVNWDPKLGTAVSDLEVDNEEEQGSIWEIRYPLADGSGALVVATTRPETMLGDTAVAVQSGRRPLRGVRRQGVALPLTGRAIPSSPTRTSTRVRHRRRQDHAGARFQRLAARPAARPARAAILNLDANGQRQRAGESTAASIATRAQGVLADLARWASS
jgi:hypothetical protein